jgi:hypothetical protein
MTFCAGSVVGRLGRSTGWPEIPRLLNPWQDTITVGSGWRQRAANLAAPGIEKQSARWLARVTDDSGSVEWCHGSDLGPVPVSEQPRQRRGSGAL